MSAASRRAGAVFGWEIPRFSWQFVGFVLLSLVAHVGSFFLFGVRYPQHVTIPPPAPEVTLLLPTTPENRALLLRIAADDSALGAATAGVTPPALAEVRYQPSYDITRTQPRSFVEPPVSVQFPPPKDPLAIIRSLEKPAAPATAAPPPQPTRVTFSPPLQSRWHAEIPPWKLTSQGATPLDPAVFLVGVTDRGELRYTFLQRSSGDASIDQQLAAQLPRFDFQQSAADIAWGIATITFGDDVYPPAK